MLLSRTGADGALGFMTLNPGVGSRNKRGFGMLSSSNAVFLEIVFSFGPNETEGAFGSRDDDGAMDELMWYAPGPGVGFEPL